MITAIRNNRPGLYDAGGFITLLPGVNRINTPALQTAWEKAKKNPVVAARLHPSHAFPGGELRELTAQAAGNEAQTVIPRLPEPVKKIVIEPQANDGKIKAANIEAADFDGLKRQEKLSAVATCADIDRLQEWHGAIRDNTVKSAIDGRIAELTREQPAD